jgi:hypothetical protein
MRNDDLVAKCSPRGWGSVVWTGYYARGFAEVSGRDAAVITGKTPAMTYVMEHCSSTRRAYRTIDEIKITNLYCGPGNGWDLVVLGDIVGHERTKTEAQGEAEKLLDGSR